MCGFGFFGGANSWLFIGMNIIRFVIFAGIIAFGVSLLRNYMSGNSSSIKILNEKFAKGEINEEEYIRRKSTLSQK